MEAEFVALSHATKDAIWLRTLLTDLGFPPSGPIRILCDNQAAISYSHDHQFHARTKHIDIKYHFIRKQIKNSTIELKYVLTEDNIADLFTKPLDLSRFKPLDSRLGLHRLS